MRLSTLILPTYRWTEGRSIWRRAEELGFDAGYTYDHLSWQSFRDRTWFGAVPTLAAAATATERLRIGPLVTSPNFRHPVTLAKELMSLDDLSAGRLTVGIGAGGVGFDASVLGQLPWPPGERADRFEEFVALLDRLLTQPATTEKSAHYAAVEARMMPGCVQEPRAPFIVAATGRRGFDLVAGFGAGWVTFGDSRSLGGGSADTASEAVRAQLDALGAACARQGRDVDSVDKLLLQGLTAERPLTSLDAFVDWAGRYQQLGITEVVVHWPIADSIFAADLDVFETIAIEGPAQFGSVVPVAPDDPVGVDDGGA
jgi:alkanesulfonate monooxygenase SsuD/methylene tetrahydromethanopterin reductase-like flavin-dependent oxidoreductase (luciferase family)